MTTRVISREPEATAVARFLAAAVAAPAALVIEGEPGIGKTTLWLEAIDRARADGFRVLVARPAAAESVAAYACLADLLDGIEASVVAQLPPPQRVALDRVLHNSADQAPSDQRAVAASFLSVLGILAETSKVLVAIDDLQWLDSSSRLVVAFAARRLAGPVAMLATIRTGADENAGSWLQLPRPDDVWRIAVPPMTVGALHAVIKDRLGHSLSRPLMVRIGEASRGNPFYALELAKTTDHAHAGADIVLPDSLTELVRSKIRSPAPLRDDALLAVACLAAPTVGVVARALGSDPGDVVGQLEHAESGGVVEIDGERIRFNHPIFARGVYNDAAPERRRTMHTRLADVVGEPELRARHRALGATTADDATVEALDSAAHIARSRGAPAAAAELIELAISLGGDTPRRLIDAAAHHFNAGDSGRARTLLDEAMTRLHPGVLRAEAAGLLGYVRLLDDSFPEAAALLEGALDEAADDPDVLVPMLVTLSFALFNAGRLGASARRVEEAVSCAERSGDARLLSQALSMREMVRLLQGSGLDETSIRRALELADDQTGIPFALRPSVHNAILRSCTGELDAAHAELTRLRKACVEGGQEGEMMLVAFQGTLVEMWRGQFAGAALIAEDTLQLAHQLGGDLPLSVAMTCRALVAAYTGQVDEARAAIAEALAASRRCGSTRLGEWPATTLAFLEVSIGNHRAAFDAIEPLLAAADVMPDATEIISASFMPEAIEAMVGLNQLESAEKLVLGFERNGARLHRDWMTAVGGRGRGMVAAARGELQAAIEAVEGAMVAHDRIPMPFERARTQLLLGQLQRRQRLKEASAVNVSTALETFERLGTPLWAQRARVELGRAAAGALRQHTLRPSELQIAELAASGMTNRTIAATMFISPKTVEANLARIYAKLGIRSRAELGRHVAALKA